MRITDKTMSNTYMRNLTRNLNQMQKYHNQLSSGKLISKPSDDPMLVGKIMSLSNNVMQNHQYSTNIKDTIGWVDTQDSALNTISGTLNRIRDLVIYASNGPLSDTDRDAIKDEMEMKVGELVDALNTNFDGRYIFGGQETTEPPYKMVEVERVDDDGNFITDEDGNRIIDSILTYKGDTNNVQREISPGVVMDLVTDGSKITGANDGLGKLLNKITNAIGEGDLDALSGPLLEELDVRIDDVIRVRSNIGAIQNRLDAAQSRNVSENLNLNELLSEREDIDIAEKYMEFSVMSSVYQASLAVGAQILQPTLLDHIR